MLDALPCLATSEMFISFVAWLLDATVRVKVPWRSRGEQGEKFTLGEHRHPEFARLVEF